MNASEEKRHREQVECLKAIADRLADIERALQYMVKHYKPLVLNERIGKTRLRTLMKGQWKNEKNS